MHHTRRVRKKEEENRNLATAYTATLSVEYFHVLVSREARQNHSQNKRTLIFTKIHIYSKPRSYSDGSRSSPGAPSGVSSSGGNAASTSIRLGGPGWRVLPPRGARSRVPLPQVLLRQRLRRREARHASRPRWPGRVSSRPRPRLKPITGG